MVGPEIGTKRKITIGLQTYLLSFFTIPISELPQMTLEHFNRAARGQHSIKYTYLNFLKFLKYSPVNIQTWKLKSPAVKSHY